MTDWKEQALKDLRTTTMSRADVAQKYNRSPSTIQRLMETHEIERPKGQKERQRPLSERQPLSKQHHWLGIKMQIHDTGHLQDQIGASHYTFAAMKAGVHNFTLLELQKLCEVLQVDLLEFLKPIPALGRKAS